MQQRCFAAVEGQEPWFGNIYFFRGPSYFRYSMVNEAMDPDYPKPLSAWDLPDSFQTGVDAALNGMLQYAGKAYFFKGNTYVRYDWKNETVEFTKPLSAWNLPSGFEGGIDAALNGMGEYYGKAYFFKGNQYARYDWAEGKVEFTKPISAWNLPWDFRSNLDAVVTAPANYVGHGKYLGKSWFFKGHQYVRYQWDRNAVDYRSTLVEWDFQKERKQIIAKAREMMASPEIHALTLGPDSTRVGWQKLKTIFDLAAPDIIAGNGLERRLKRSNKISNEPDAIPDWCGIYDLWAIKAAGLNVGTWVTDQGLNKVNGFRSLHDITMLDVGDVVVRPPDFSNHHALITRIGLAGKIDIISGNWARTRNDNESTIGEEQDRSISDYSAGWFTAFPP